MLFIRARWLIAVALAAIAGPAIAVALAAGPAYAASPTYDLQGSWIVGTAVANGSVTGSNGTYTIASMDMSTGAFSGTAVVDGIDFAVSGTESGSVATYTLSENGYIAYDTLSLGVLGDGNIGGSGTFTDNGGVTSPEGFAAELTSKLRTSATQVNCSAFNPGSGSEYFQCTATVADASGSSVPLTPTGDVSFSIQAGGGGGFQGSSTCQLQPSQSGPTAYCSVIYLPPGGTLATGTQPQITAAYQGDQTFAPSSSTPQSSVVTTTNPGDVTPTTDTTSAPTTTTSTTTTAPCDSAQVRAHAMPRDAPCSKYGLQVATLNELKGLNGPAGSAYIIHSDGTFEVASVGSPIYVGDTILTTQGTVGAIQFVLGGRVGINSNDGINVVSERSATEVNSTLDNLANGTITPSGIIQHLKQMNQPVLIQTNGGVMGIKG